MDAESSDTNPDSRPEDRRRSRRLAVSVPVVLRWEGLDGLSASAEGRALEGNNHGGLLAIADPPTFGKEAVLTNLVSRQTIRVQVLSLRTTKEGAVRGLAVQFLSPSETFWGAAAGEGNVGADSPTVAANAVPSTRARRWKALLDVLLGRPRI